jgi:hypothetical protein
VNRKFWLLYLLIVASVCVFVAGFEFNLIAFLLWGYSEYSFRDCNWRPRKVRIFQG